MQGGGGADDLADRPVAHAVPAADRPDHGRAGLDPDAGRQHRRCPDGGCAGAASSVARAPGRSADRRDDAQCRAQGPFGVVFVRLRGAEEHRHAEP